MLLNEEFYITKGVMGTKYGKAYIAYIDPKISESTFQFKDEIKKYGARFINTMKTWGWFLSANPEDEDKNGKTINDKIIPCMKYLLSVETKKENGSDERNVDSVINKVLSILRNNEVAEDPENQASVVMETSDQIEEKLQSLKEELLNCMTNEEFEKKLMPIIRFRNAQGGSFSFLNSILIVLQKPNARMVKSSGNWKAANKIPKKGAKSIALWVPKGGKVFVSKIQKERITKDFLDKARVSSVDSLTVGQKEMLRKLLNTTHAVGYELISKFYDIADVEQIEGKEDLVGSVEDLDSIEWYDDKGEETPDLINKVDALAKFITSDKAGVKIKYVGADELNGAQGYSTSNGEIVLNKDAKKNVGLLDTMVHEFAHEALHFQWLNSKNSELRDEFIGTARGQQVVEQQAEMTAWITVRLLGYQSPTSINYIGVWGGNKKNCSDVFDEVSRLANRITLGIERNMNGMNESRNMLIREISGEELAAMVGCEDEYLQSKMMKKRSVAEKPFSKKLRKQFKENFEKYFGKEF